MRILWYGMTHLLKVFILINWVLICYEGSPCSRSDHKNGGPDSVFAYSKLRDRSNRELYALSSVKLDKGHLFTQGKHTKEFFSSFSLTNYSCNEGIFSDTKKKSQADKFLIFRTNGSSTCLERADLADQSSKRDCVEHSQHFQGLTDYCSNQNITKISGTQLFSGYFLFSIHTNNFKSVEYHQVLLRQDGQLSSSKKSKIPLPTALVSVKEDDSVLAFFDNIVGEYKFDTSSNSLLTLNRKIDYESSKSWLSSEPDFCFDGRIDSLSLTTTESRPNTMLVHKGFRKRYSSLEESGPWLYAAMPLDSIEELPADGATRQLYSVDAECFVRTNDTRSVSVACREMFPELTLISETGSHDAVFIVNQTKLVFIVAGSQYASYIEDGVGSNRFTYKEYGLLSDLWSGLPLNIDGATQIGDNLVFTWLHFVYITSISEMKSENSGVKEIKLIQEFFKGDNCTDRYYSQSKETAQLNISTIHEFKAYRFQFLSNHNNATKSAETLATEKTKSKKKNFVIQFILLICIILAFIATFLYLKTISKPSKNFASSNNLLTAPATPSQSLMLLEEKYDKAHGGDCADYSQKFKGLTDYCQTLNVSGISGTQLNNGQYLFSIHSRNGNDIYYDQLLLNQDGSLKKAKISITPLPTALSSVPKYDGKTETLIAFFGNIMAYYRYDVSKMNLLTINRKIDYQSSFPWLDCQPQLCFDGRISSISRARRTDHAYKLSKGKYVRFFSPANFGKWLKMSSHYETNDRLPDIAKTPMAYIHSHESDCYIENAKFANHFPCASLFLNFTLILSARHLDAIFVIDAQRLVFIVTGDKYISYREDDLARANFTYVEHGLLSHLWSGLPSEIDGATRSTDEKITFIRENFVFSTNISTMKQNGAVQEVKLVQEAFNLDGCDDQYYKNSEEAALLGISSFKDFKAYRLKFDPRITRNKPLSTSSTKMASRTRKMPRTSKMTPRRTKAITKFLWMLLIGLICALVVTFIILKLRSKSLKQSFRAAFSTIGPQRPYLLLAGASETT
ncbi:hypothetical protein HDE_14365 [Halotydeus destructor]|nr:hypothetical protein HDE_14365 [Halotydeus destructor]